MDQETIGHRIARLRIATGLSQKQLAAVLKVSSGTVAQWEIGLTNPTVARIPALAAALGVECGELFARIEGEGTDVDR